MTSRRLLFVGVILVVGTLIVAVGRAAGAPLAVTTSSPGAVIQSCIVGNPDAVITGTPDDNVTTCTYYICAQSIYAYYTYDGGEPYPILWMIGGVDTSGAYFTMDTFDYSPDSSCNPATFWSITGGLFGYQPLKAQHCKGSYLTCFGGDNETTFTAQGEQGNSTRQIRGLHSPRKCRANLAQTQWGGGANSTWHTDAAARHSASQSHHGRMDLALCGTWLQLPRSNPSHTGGWK